MMKMTKNLLLGIAAVCGSTFQAVACTGISLTSRDGSYVQARTIDPRYIGKRMRTMLISLKTPIFLPICTGCNRREEQIIRV